MERQPARRRGHREPLQEVVPGIWRVEIPLGGTSLATSNAYLLRDGDGFVLVDAGIDSPAWSVLADAMAQLGATPGDIGRAVVTHGHRDHFGLAARLQRDGALTLLAHRAEGPYLTYRYSEEYRTALRTLLWRHGLGADEADGVAESVTARERGVALPRIDHRLGDGETIRVGDRELLVVWTPGHTPGHVCLYEPVERLLFAGDHVLPHIRPNVSWQPGSSASPMGEYLRSLERVIGLGARGLLPGHGPVIGNATARARAVLRHQLDRRTRLLEALTDRPRTAAELSDRAWRRLPDDPLIRRNAIGTLIAHLALLAEDGDAAAVERPDGRTGYRTPTGLR